MMRRLWLFLTDSRHFTILGLAAMAGLYYLGAEFLELALIWVIGATCATVLLWLAVRWLRRMLAARHAASLAQAIEETAGPSGTAGGDVDVLRAGLLDAIDTIRTSKLGIKTGSRALYELPCVSLRESTYPTPTIKQRLIATQPLLSVNALT